MLRSNGDSPLSHHHLPASSGWVRLSLRLPRWAGGRSEGPLCSVRLREGMLSHATAILGTPSACLPALQPEDETPQLNSYSLTPQKNPRCSCFSEHCPWTSWGHLLKYEKRLPRTMGTCTWRSARRGLGPRHPHQPPAPRLQTRLPPPIRPTHSLPLQERDRLRDGGGTQVPRQHPRV